MAGGTVSACFYGKPSKWTSSIFQWRWCTTSMREDDAYPTVGSKAEAYGFFTAQIQPFPRRHAAGVLPPSRKLADRLQPELPVSGLATLGFEADRRLRNDDFQVVSRKRRKMLLVESEQCVDPSFSGTCRNDCVVSLASGNVRIGGPSK